jgi:6-phospho-3-hexuloisomerase
MTNTGTNLFGIALDELGNVLARIDESRIDAACAMLAGANKIVVYGCGREALQVKGLPCGSTISACRCRWSAT